MTSNRQFERYSDELRIALKIRKTEYKLLDLYKQGVLGGTIHTSVGQEIIPVLLYRSLGRDDWIFSNHRGHAHYLARTGDYYGLIAEVLGRVDGASAGIGGSQHLYSHHFLANGVQGGMTPIAVGMALATKIKHTGSIVVCHIGDGTLGEGLLYESLNLASLWKVPVLYVLEDNEIAQSTITSTTIAGSIQSRFEAFGLRYQTCHSDDWGNLDNSCQEIVNHVRRGTPGVLHIKTRRLLAHSKGDDNRDPAYIRQIQEADPINIAIGTVSWLADFEREIDRELESTTLRAQQSPQRRDGPLWQPIFRRPSNLEPANVRSSTKVIEQIRSALQTRLTTDVNAIVLGEDIQYKGEENSKPYGGAFKVTGDLSEQFPFRVRNTPISEAAMVGCGTGLALAGCPATVEIMFGDFTTLIVDQLFQHASKFHTMYGRDLAVPICVRTPMGGRRGYGPTHSQSIERLFVGLPNLHLFSPNHRVDVEKLYKAIFSLGVPTFVAEHKLGYNLGNERPVPDQYEVLSTKEQFPTLLLRPVEHQPSATVLTYGYGLALTEKALSTLAQHGVWMEVVCPTRLSPLNTDLILKSLIRTQRFVGFEEGSATHGVAAACLAYLVTQGVCPRSAILIGNDSIIPAGEAELATLPGEDELVRLILRMLEQSL